MTKDINDLFTKGKDFLDIYSKVAEFSKELMDENQKLQGRSNELTTQRESVLAGGVGGEKATGLMRRLEALKQEKLEIISQYRQVEEENTDFVHRYMEIESENNNLANLYVASYQLHSTLDLKEVLEIITEITNLIGARDFAILIRNEKRAVLEPVKAEGVPIDALPLVGVGEGVIGRVARDGNTYYRDPSDQPPPSDYTNPLVCLPLKIKDEIIGVIAVYRLLVQKTRLVKVDYDLFNLLAAHAATAIFSAKLYGDSIRKQATIKGFLDLLTH